MDDIFKRDIQSQMGARDFGRVDSGLVQPELIECSLMKLIEADGKWKGGLGVTKRGARFVCKLPPEYDFNVGIMPQDGRLLVTRPGLPTLIADCETGDVRRL